MPRRWVAAVAAFVLVLGQAGGALAASSAAGPPDGGGASAPIAKGLLSDLESGAADRFVVEYSASADLRSAARIKNHDRRGQAVMDALKVTAAKSQAGGKALAHRANAQATSYWLVNELVVQGDAKLARQFARLDGVAAVRAPKAYPLVKPVETKVAILAAAGDPEWGVDKIRAPEAWAEGVLGQGVVVANVDTGVDFTHPALVDHYRGNNGDGTFTHDYSWWDPTGICGDEPCDNAGHGTHTMGTMVGGDGPGPFTPDVGVAPGARWIAAKGCEDLFCSEEALLSSGQWILAPTDLTGGNPDPSLRPDVVNNSWGSGPGDSFYLATVQAWRAAGIIPVFASGNPGPFCGEGGSPGDFLESFSAGATDIDDNIAEFSGRGPSVYGKINPDISAPGVDVVSSVPGGDYESFSGTSMAAPHTSGAIALILSAEPALIGDPNVFVSVTDAVRATAVDRIDDSCGGDEDGDPNNVYGDGRIDAKAAVDLVATGGTLAGTVTDEGTGDPIAGAQVTAHGGIRDFTVATDADGHYEMFLAAGTYDVSARAFGYAVAIEAAVEIVTDETTTTDFALVALPRFDVTGHVLAAEDGSPLAGASVLALGTPVSPAITDGTGAYSLNLPIGTYTLRAAAGGCSESWFREIELVDQDIVVDFALARKLDDFGHGCRSIPLDWVDATTDTALYGDDFVGRLPLPFAFSFYGTAYDQVFISDNGYLTLAGPDRGNPDPVSIPNEAPPNAAIYALWRDLYLAGDARVSYTTAGSPGDRVFVLELTDVSVKGSAATLDLEVKLYESGETVDILYGDNPASPGDGRGATIGIESAEGTDALEFSFYDSLLTPNSAYRYEPVASGIVRGTVTDANDGEPIAGATVTAAPSLGSATTADDGIYALRLYPGSYELSFAAPGYESETTPVTIADGDDVTIDAALDAGIPAVDPVEIVVDAQFGDAPVTRTVTLSNTGSGGFDWEARERSRGSTPAEIPNGTAGKGSRAGQGLDSRTRLASWSGPTAVKPSDTSDATVLVLLDALPWESSALLDVLDANGVAYETADSSSMADIDLTPYQFVIISNDQPQEFYDAYADNFAKFDAYVGAGGLLVVEAASNGWNGGDFSGAPLPGGANVGGGVFDDVNNVAAPDHPLMAGVPDPFTGTSASHTVFENLPADATTIATSASTGEPTLVEYRSGGGSVIALAQPMEFAFETGQDGAIILENLVPYAVAYFRDLTWLSEDPSAGSLAAGDEVEVTLAIGDPTLVPGEYLGSVVFVTTAPKPRTVTVEVAFRIALPESWGGISGTVTDAHTGDPVSGVDVTLHSEWNGAPLDVPATTAGDGSYSLIGPSGTWPLEFAKDGYVPVTRDATLEAGTTTTGVDAALHRDVPHGAIDGGPFTFVRTEGETATGTITLTNPEGHEDLTFEVGEVNLNPQAAIAGVTGSRTLSKVAPNARSTRDANREAVTVPPEIRSTGDVLASWPTDGVDLPWGVGFTGNVWIGDAFDGGDLCGFGGVCTSVEYTTDGTPTGASFESPWVEAFGGDMAYDAGRGLLWQVNVGGDNAIYGFDPADGSVQQVITGSPWDNVDQRGLAYDPTADVFYIGGWNEGIVYRVAGPSHPTPGETLGQCSPADPGISGLAWNGSFGLLWEATNSETDTIYLIDPATCDTIRAIDHPSPGFNGAGLELDAVGNLWTVSQNDATAYLIESGLPTFSDVPWLTVDPESGTVAPDGSEELTVSVDATGLEPGVYRAVVVVQTNDPELGNAQVPVTLVVPAYRQGINAGGGAYTDTAADVAYAADQLYASGGFGYVGASSRRSTAAPIDGTDRDPLYQDLRMGMAAYRFAVPDGVYQVDLSFAELQLQKAGGRVFGVALEGTTVLSDFDAYAAAGGRRVAYDRTFQVEVTDGVLDIAFFAQRGDQPIVNAILVTEVPSG